MTIVLAAPRGFCAGVDRAIQVVERALDRFGPPVYVRHEIVHNRFVVEGLKAKGAVFVDELDEIPDQAVTDGAPVIFSAHGVPRSVPAAAAARGFVAIDATCPLVTRVHREAERHHREGRHVLLIGHAGHAEVLGTMGQIPPGAVTLVETAAQAETVTVPTTERVAYATQTTLSVDDAAAIIVILARRFPGIEGPRRDDICYATTNRQQAVKELAMRCDAILVIGAPNSSNSRRLVEVATRAGCGRAVLVQRAAEVEWDMLAGVRTLGITAGASAPEVLVEELLDACRARFALKIEIARTTEERTVFRLPPELQ